MFPIQGQENLLIQVVKNLIQNSLETHIEKKKLDDNFAEYIDVKTEADDKNCYLYVTDFGCGIEDDDLSGCRKYQECVNPLLTSQF